VRFSLGLQLTEKGDVMDVLADSPAGAAGMAPGLTLVAVNGRRFTKDALADAIGATRPSARKDAPTSPSGRAEVELIATDGDFYRTFHLRYAGGPRAGATARHAGRAVAHPRAARPLTAR
jgi:hypothetical protein